MNANTSLTTEATLYLASCSLMTACGSLVSLDDDVPAPPVPREARQLRIPADLASNKPDRSPITAAIATTQRAAVAAETPPPSPAVVSPPSIVPLAPGSTEVAAKSTEMLFAPYIPNKPKPTIMPDMKPANNNLLFCLAENLMISDSIAACWTEST